MKIRIKVSGGEQGEVVHQCDSHQVVIGRSPNCDVTVPVPHVSGQHAMVVQGIAVIDLKSTNGTFVAGRRIENAAAAPGGRFMLGSEVEVAVEADVVTDADPGEYLDFEATLVSGQEASLDVTPSPSTGVEPSAPLPPAVPIPAVRPDEVAGDDPDLSTELDRQRAENDDLRRRLDSLKKDIEEREIADADSPQARLAHDAMQSVRDQNEALQARVLELEKEKGRADVEAAKRVLEARVTELESSKADLVAKIGNLEGQLEEAQTGQAAAEASPASEIFFKLQGEVARLKAELAEAKSDGKGDDESSALFFDLRVENEELKKKLEEADAQAEPETTDAPDDPSRVAELERELHSERMSKADMLDELSSLRARAEASAPGATPATQPGGIGQALALLARAAREDVTQVPTDFRLPTEEFLALELFRSVRHGEKVVTRLAGQFLQLYDPQTMLPGAEKTLREFTQDLVESGDDENLRVEFTEYLESMKGWLGAAIHAYPEAAVNYALQLRDKLSEASLTEAKPIPTLKRLSGQAEGELWERATKVLNGVSDETVRDGVERLARDLAAGFIKEAPKG